MAIEMAVTMVYLATLSSQWRLTFPAYGDNKAANLEAIVAAE